MSRENEYRVTLGSRAPREELNSRNGHYIVADSPREAAAECKRLTGWPRVFTVQAWGLNTGTPGACLGTWVFSADGDIGVLAAKG